MKNFLKTFLILLILTIGTQKSFSQMKFGLRAGLNVATVAQDFKESDFEETTKMRILYSFGAVMDLSLIPDVVSLQPGLLLSAKGYSVDVKKDYDGTGYDRYIINYLEIPVNIAFKMKAFQIYAGPYVAIGIAGKDKYDIDYGDGSNDKGDDKFKFVGKEASLEDMMGEEIPVKRLDYGLNFGLGYMVGPILINAGYSLGLSNMTPDIADIDFEPKDYKVSNRVITASVTFFLGK
jgi:hypothetical protein